MLASSLADKTSHPHTGKHRIDQFERLVDLFTDLGAGQYNLSTDEDQKNNLRLHHAVDKTREQLRLVRAEVVVAASQALQTNGELDVTGTDDVLDLEIRELRVEAELLNDTSILPRCQLRVILRFRTGNDHLTRGEDQRGGLRLTDTHDHGRETL